MTKGRKNWRVVCARCLEERNAQWITPGSGVIEALLYVLTVPFLCAGGLMYSGIRSVFAH